MAEKILKDITQKIENSETTLLELADISDELKKLVDVFSNLVKKAVKASDKVKQTKSDMHDCKIPKTVENRDVEIKKYVEKLEEIEKNFEPSKKLNEDSSAPNNPQ